MFYKRSSTASAIENEVFSGLQSQSGDTLGRGLEALSRAAEDFETAGLDEEAEAVTQVIERIASGEFAMIKEAKRKEKFEKGVMRHKNNPRKKEVPVTKKQLDNLSPEGKKALKNLEQNGWMFDKPKDLRQKKASDEALIVEAKGKKKNPFGGHEMGRGMIRNEKDPGEIPPVVQKEIKNLSPAGKKALKKLKKNHGDLSKMKRKACECNDGEDEMSALDGFHKCPECGFSHDLEPEEAYAAHHGHEMHGWAEPLPEEREDDYLLNSLDV